MNKLIFLIILYPTLLFAQSARQQAADREMKALEELYLLDKATKKESTDSTEKILSYRNEVKDEIRKNRSKLTDKKYNAVLNYEKQYWQIVIDRRAEYTFNTDFLAREIPLLNKYRENTLDFLYSNYEKSNLVKNDDELNKCLNDNKNLFKYAQDLISQNDDLARQNQLLKNQNTKLIEASKDMTILTPKGAETIEKALDALKEKDLKIRRLQEELIKKDSIILKLSKNLEK